MASLFSIFLVFLRIGAFTIGGGYAMIVLIQKEITSREWIDEDEFDDLVVLAQSAPGLLAVNIAIFAGFRIRGTAGSVAATLGAIMAPFFMILLIASIFTNFQDSPVVVAIFKGIRPAVVSLILVPMINMARKSNKNIWMWIICAASLVLVAFLRVSPVYILLTTIILTTAVAYALQKKGGEK